MRSRPPVASVTRSPIPISSRFRPEVHLSWSLIPKSGHITWALCLLNGPHWPTAAGEKRGSARSEGHFPDIPKATHPSCPRLYGHRRRFWFSLEPVSADALSADNSTGTLGNLPAREDSSVTTHSSPAAKIALFRSLFRGR